MASEASKECEVCKEEFNEGRHCPRSLPCSHCYCSSCIDQLILSNRKFCPVCRKSFRARAATDFSINRKVLDLLKYVAELEKNANSPRLGEATSLEKIRDENAEIGKRNLAQCNRVAALIENAMRINIKLRDDILLVNGVIKDEILTKLKEIETQTVEQIRYIEEENKRLKTHLDWLSGREKHIKDPITKLQAAKNFTDAAPVIDKAKEFNKRLEKSMEELKDFLSKDRSTRQRIRKSADDTNGKINIVQEVLSTVGEEKDEIDLTPGVVPTTIQEEAPTYITVDTLRRMSGSLKEIVREGKLFAFQDLQERRRYARITATDEGQIFLHHLREVEPLPSNVHLIKHDDVMSLVDISCRRTFLDLAVEGKSLGKLLIRLFNDEILPKQFSMLCTGEMGPSYANSNILEVGVKGHERENVKMGDYETNDGGGGKALVVGVNWAKEWNREIYKREWVKGTVQGSYSITEAKASQFFIVTKDSKRGHLYGSLGMVEEGLPVLKKAISKHLDVEKIKVLDCGIVFSRLQNEKEHSTHEKNL